MEDPSTPPPGPRRATLPGGWLLQSGPFLILAATAAWVGTQWHRVPLWFPIHYGIAGRPDAWAERSIGRVFAPSVIGIVLCAFILLLATAAARSRPARAAGPAAEAERRLRTLALAFVLGSEYLVAFVFGVLAAVPLVRDPAGPLAATTALTVAFLVVSVAVIVPAGRRLAAARRSSPPNAP
jgi:uncharacterized membrane protein